MKGAPLSAKTDDLHLLLEEATAEAISHGFRIYPGGISIEYASALWHQDQEIAAFLDFAKSLGKTIVYIDIHTLTPQTVLDSLVLALDEPHGIFQADSPETFFKQRGGNSRPELKEYLRVAAHYYSRPTRLTVEWVNDGIVHRFIAQADWYSGFLDLTADVADLIDSILDEDT